ncbi:MAG: 2-phosphosulfolactate phosphatase [Gemmatimonadales bacterium]|jgi:2-phosphosulfolactate phosphatase
MRLDVAFSPAGLAPGEVAGRTIAVIDILRATTTICAALHAGARAVLPVPSTAEALRLAQTLGSDDVLLAGERQGLRIDGFPLGNSPREMIPDAVRGRTIIMTTTNGTGALLATQGAHQVFLASAANFGAAAARARETWVERQDLLVLCAGRDGHFGLDDAYAAGRLVEAALARHRTARGLNDAAVACLDLVRRYGRRFDRPLAVSAAGRHLAEIGFAEDVAFAAREDTAPVLPLYAERRVTLTAA